MAAPIDAPLLSIVIPVYNEREWVAELVRRVLDVNPNAEYVVTPSCHHVGEVLEKFCTWQQCDSRARIGGGAQSDDVVLTMPEREDD